MLSSYIEASIRIRLGVNYTTTPADTVTNQYRNLGESACESVEPCTCASGAFLLGIKTWQVSYIYTPYYLKMTFELIQLFARFKWVPCTVAGPVLNVVHRAS